MLVRLEILLAAGLLATVALVSACAGPETGVPASTPSGPASASTSPPPSGSPSAGGDRLVILSDDGHGNTVRWQLICDPPGGDHPDADGACEILARNGEHALPPVAKNKVCSQVYAGPEKASISGTWRGRAVRATFSRNNSCETARWAALVPLLPSPGVR